MNEQSAATIPPRRAPRVAQRPRSSGGTVAADPAAGAESADAAAVELWNGYDETAQAVRESISARLRRETSLSSSDHAVLHALGSVPPSRVRSARLASMLRWERSRLSHQVGRMEVRGLVARAPAEDDGRGAWIILTQNGAGALIAAEVSRMRAVSDLFGSALDRTQADAAADLSSTLRAHLAAVGCIKSGGDRTAGDTS